MIVSDSKRFIFIHNPKCGGTSVRMSLMQFETTANFFWMFDEFNNKKIDKAHLPLFLLRAKYPTYYDLLDRYFVFCFVRDPYSRTVSAFNETSPNLLADLKDQDHEILYKQKLNNFVTSLNSQTIMGWDIRYRHLVRQRDMIYISDKCAADVVMKIEEWPSCLDRLDVFMPFLSATLRSSKVLNKRESIKKPLEYLSRESIRKINLLYKDDFALFGYEANL